MELEALVAAVLASANYRSISPALVRRIGERELAARSNLKAAIKATKSKLHQVAGAYVERTQYATWLGELQAANNPVALQAACRNAMAGHASARERLGIVERFYHELFARLGAVQRVLDLACGLNPLALPWMPPTITHYAACDLDADLVGFVDGFLKLAGVAGGAEVCDLLGGPPPVAADVTLVLKTLPVLDQLRRDGGRDLLRALTSPQIVVSYPTRSLGGHGKGFAQSYAARFQAMAHAEGWAYEQLEFPGELVFVVRKGGAD